MIADKNLDRATQHPHAQMKANFKPHQAVGKHAQASRSTDSLPHKTPAKRPDAWLKRRNKNKIIRWDKTVVDNEKAPKIPSVRPPTPPLHQRPTPQRPEATRPSSQNSLDTMYQDTVSRYKNHVNATASKPVKLQPFQLLQPIQGMTLRDEMKLNTAKPLTARVSGVPPAAPDAPQLRAQRPPSTPRITRLPTPELPELKGKSFCDCGRPDCTPTMYAKSKKPSEQ